MAYPISGGGATSLTYSSQPVLTGGEHESIAQLVQLARDAGFSATQAPVAAAIARWESNGWSGTYDPETAAGTTPGHGSYGLWRVYATAHPELARQYDLYDPQQNAAAAYRVYQQQGWSAWTGYKTGGYLRFLPQALAATPGAYTSSADKPGCPLAMLPLAFVGAGILTAIIEFAPHIL